MKASIPVTIRVQDNQDGGYTVYAYPSDEAMLADHPNNPQSEEEKNDILEENDAYENGYISHETIEIEFDPRGACPPVLAKEICWGVGQ